MINLSKCQFVKSSVDKKSFLTDRPQVVFLGKSNVGKSSLVNALTSSKLAQVSKMPGRTQQINYFDIEGKYYLTDAPGYGYFTDSQLDFEPMMLAYLSLGSKIIKRAYLLIDSRRGLSEDDETVYNLIYQAKIPVRVVFTKCDKLNQSGKAQLENLIKRQFVGVKTIACSSLKKDGIEILRRDVENALE
jgi:GTP-binding protein